MEESEAIKKAIVKVLHNKAENVGMMLKNIKEQIFSDR